MKLKVVKVACENISVMSVIKAFEDSKFIVCQKGKDESYVYCAGRGVNKRALANYVKMEEKKEA